MQMFFDYLRTHDLTKVAPGRIVLEGDRLFLNVADSKKQPREERKLEAHRKYIDIQVPLTANETVGWRPLKALTWLQTLLTTNNGTSCSIASHRRPIFP